MPTEEFPDGAPYEPDGVVPARTLLWTPLLGALGVAIAAILWMLALRFAPKFYGLFPAGAGCVLGMSLSFGLSLGRCRNAGFGVGCSTIAALSLCIAMVQLAALEASKTPRGLWDGADQSTLILWALLVVAMAGIPSFCATTGAFCARCNRWHKGHTVLQRLSTQTEPVTERLRERDWSGLLDLPHDGGSQISVYLNRCEGCGASTMSTFSMPMQHASLPPDLKHFHLSRENGDALMCALEAHRAQNP